MLRLLMRLTTMLLGATASAAASPPAPHLVFMIGEDEYRTRETLPAFAAVELRPRGYRVTVVESDPADKNRFPGLEAALREADLLFLSVRRRPLPQPELQAIRAHLQAGKPLVGIRTASHAFCLRAGEPLVRPELVSWPEFDAEVLGGHYHDHYGDGPKTTLALAPGAETHPVLHGISGHRLSSHGSLYKTSPLGSTTTPLLFGSVPDHPPEPVAWTHRYGPRQARVFYTSLGHPDDFSNPQFRRLLANAVRWALAEPPDTTVPLKKDP